MNTSTFFVTVMKNESSAWPRPIGMYDELTWAEKVILENKQEIQKDVIRGEDFYDYAVIEEIPFGLFGVVKNRWIYEFNGKKWELTHVEPNLDDCQSMTGLF